MKRTEVYKFLLTIALTAISTFVLITDFSTSSSISFLRAWYCVSLLVLCIPLGVERLMKFIEKVKTANNEE